MSPFSDYVVTSMMTPSTLSTMLHVFTYFSTFSASSFNKCSSSTAAAKVFCLQFTNATLEYATSSWSYRSGRKATWPLLCLCDVYIQKIFASICASDRRRHVPATRANMLLLKNAVKRRRLRKIQRLACSNTLFIIYYSIIYQMQATKK